MNEAHKNWVGLIINQEFQLRQYLGGSESSAVFLTDRTDRKSKDTQSVAIKLIPADRTTSEKQLSRYNAATKLFHPHLLRIFECGRCHLDHSDFIYVVMEYAEENLSQIVPSRPLTPAESREMLIPVLDALAYLHAKGFIHGRVKPANIMAANDQLKLSSDGLVSTRAPADIPPPKPSIPKPSIYDPPELAAGTRLPAGDVWSLGITLVEVLTQHPPAAQRDSQSSPIVPDTLPSPFLEIVRHCLVVDPTRRWTIAEISEHLNPKSFASSSSRVTPAVQSSEVASPAAPSRKAPPTPISARPAAPPAAGPSDVPPRPPVSSSQTQARPRRPQSRKTPGNRRYLIPTIAAIVVLIAIFGGARLLNRRESPPVSTNPAQLSSSGASSGAPSGTSRPSQYSSPSKDAPSPSQPIRESARSESKSYGKPPSSETSRPSKQPLTPRNSQTAANPSSAEDNGSGAGARDASRGVRSDTAAKTSSSSGSSGEVLQQDIPNVSPKASASIQGRVRVSIKVHVDQSGSVTGAEFLSPGSSKYFADLAMKSARKWEFAPAKQDGTYVPSDWILRYEFTNSGTKVSPQQISR